MRSGVASALLLLAAVVVCRVAAQNVNNAHSYYYMEPGLRKFVDQAIVAGNRQLNHHGHLNYEGIGQMAEISDRQVKIDVRLRATTCRKDSGNATHRPDCPFKRLKVRCFVCGWCPYSRKPFIDCVRRKDENSRHALWNQKCTPAPRDPSSLSLIHGGTGCPMRFAKGEKGIAGRPGRQSNIRVSPYSEGVYDGQWRVLRGSRFNISCYHKPDRDTNTVPEQPPPYACVQPPVQPPVQLPALQDAANGPPHLLQQQVIQAPLELPADDIDSNEQMDKIHQDLLPGRNPDTSTLPKDSWYLTFDSGSSVVHFHRNSPVFLFPAADHSHQGTYRCGYGVVVDGRVYNERWRSEPLSLSVIVTYTRPTISVSPSVTGVPEPHPIGHYKEGFVIDGKPIIVSSGNNWRPANRWEWTWRQVMLEEGSAFTVTCSIEERHPHSYFQVAVGSGPDNAKLGPAQPSVNGSAHFLFPAADRRTHRGEYACVYRVAADDGHSYASGGEPISLNVTETNLTPLVSVVSPSVKVSWAWQQGQWKQQATLEEGSAFTITCSIREDEQRGSTFHLTFDHGPDSQPQPCVRGSAHFQFPAAQRRAHQGDYACAHVVTVDRFVFTRRSAPLALSIRESAARGRPRGPTISVFPSLSGGVSQEGAPQQQQQQVLEGFGFAVTCSVQEEEEEQRRGACGGVFYLTFDSALKEEKPCGYGSASFPFPEANRTHHQGVYRCVYATEDTYAWSEPLPIAVTGTSVDSFRDNDYFFDGSDY